MKFNNKYLLALFLESISIKLMAGTVNNDINYQVFRDFAENKGLFHYGVKDVFFYNKNGELTGSLGKYGMPDFSSVDKFMGVSTLINPQYIASVKHNGGYQSVSFGDGENRYNIIDRNNSPTLDFHTPRLDKLVTEVIPTDLTAQGAVSGAYMDKEHYPVFYRIGSGTQYIKDNFGNLTSIGGAYSWLTGGTVGNLSSYQNGQMITASSGLVFDYNHNGAIPIYGEAGDSGSPLFAWDNFQNKWVLVGVLTAGNGAGGKGNNWAVIPLDFIRQKFDEDKDIPINFDGSYGNALVWTFDRHSGNGSLMQGISTYTMHGQKGSDLNAGKNLVFLGENGLIDLQNSIYQGAGSLTFKNNYTVKTDNGSTWTGAGIIVDKEASVVWQVNGLKGDNLHKLGEGTLIVEGSGVNEGGLKIGDGKIILNQQADNNGHVQAFKSVNIASGRPTVVLTNDRQVNPDSISWGYRGGVLDVNGNDITFHQLKAADYGAVLANNADKEATITLNYAMLSDNVELHSWSGARQGNIGSLYIYNNPYTKTTDYFILKQTSYGYFPTNQNSNDTWEYVGHNKNEAQKLVADHFNSGGYLYHGQLKGWLNIENHLPAGTSGALVMDGSTDVYGTFSQENGRLTLQGHPVIHAYNHQSVADKLAATGDYSVLTQPTSFSQDDWESRSFSFNKLLLNKTDFGLARNATLNTVLEATDSKVILGDQRVFLDKKDGDGTLFILQEGLSDSLNNEGKSVFNGTAKLNGKTTLHIRNAIFNGDIHGHTGSNVELSSISQWNITKTSSLDLFSTTGGTISLAEEKWKPKTLTINTMHASNMELTIGVCAKNNQSDRIDIINKATGGNNILNISYLLNNNNILKSDLTLASAPIGTSRDYFSFASLKRGFTIYTPKTFIEEKDGRIFWRLKGHSQITDPDISMGTDNDTLEENVQPPALPNHSNNGNITTGEENNTASSQETNPSSDSSTEKKLNNNTIYTENDNLPLLKKTRAMYSAREFILSDSSDRWIRVIDNNNTNNGLWATTDYSGGKYDSFTLTQKGLNVGFRQSSVSGTWWGIGTELYRGYSHSNSFQDSFSMWGGYLLAGQNFTNGGFVQGMVGYRQLSENFSIQDELKDLSGKVKSHILTSGIRSGWKSYIRAMNMTITPVIALNTVITDGYQINGLDRSVAVHNGNAVWLKSGIKSEKIISDKFSLNTGLWRSITLSNMPGITLRDNWKSRHYEGKNTNHYAASIGIDGKLTKNITLKANFNSRFKGSYNNVDGAFGITYKF